MRVNVLRLNHTWGYVDSFRNRHRINTVYGIYVFDADDRYVYEGRPSYWLEPVDTCFEFRPSVKEDERLDLLQQLDQAKMRNITHGHYKPCNIIEQYSPNRLQPLGEYETLDEAAAAYRANPKW